MNKLSLCLAATLVASIPQLPSSYAQPSDSAAAGKIPVARRLYEEGVDAVNQGRWSTAHDKFKASYELSPRVLTLFNLAGAQVQTKRYVEAAESYRRFLRETADGRYTELRAEAVEALAELEKQIAHLTLVVTNLDASDTVAIDDVPYPRAALGEPFPMNPGSHVAVVRRDGATLAEKSITLSPGVAETVTLTVEKRTDLRVRSVDGEAGLTGTDFSTNKKDKEKGGSVLRSPWFWTAAAVVVAGAATGAYFMTRPDEGVLVVR
jgi:hypothetical protein